MNEADIENINLGENKYEDEFGAADRAHYRDACDDIFERELGTTAESRFLLNVCSVISKLKALHSDNKLSIFNAAMLELPYAYDKVVSTSSILSVSTVDALSWVFGWMLHVGKTELDASDIKTSLDTLNAKWFDTPIDPYGILRMTRFWITMSDPKKVPIYFEAQ